MTSVAVMLPARIETRFDTDQAGAARLRVIVIPADVWFDRHDPRVSEQDIEALRAAAQACDGDLFGEAGAAAFERLAGQVGAGRAAWLGTTLLTHDAGGWALAEPDLRRAPEEPAAARTIRGLPGLVEVWATLVDSREIRLATLRPKPELRVEPGEAGGPATFWPRWGVLKRAGLTATINLAEADGGGPIDPADIAVLTVVGLGTADPGPLLTAHRHAGAASLMPPGSPTNSTPEAGYRRPGPLDWRHAAVATSAPSQQVADAIGAPVSLPGADDGHRDLQSLLVSALWPALWGHALQDLAGWPAGEDAARIRSGLWWPQYVFPEGPFPSLLVGDQPYGVLPATIVAKLAGSGGPPGWTGNAVSAYLAQAAGRAESGIGTVVDADTDTVLKVLAHTPVSTGYRYRWSVPAAYLGGALKNSHANRLAGVLDPLGVDAAGLVAPQIAVGSSAPVDLPLMDPAGPEDPPNWVYRMLDDLWRDVEQGLVDEADFRTLKRIEPRFAGNRHRLWLLRLVALCRRHAPEVGVGSFAVVLEALGAYEVAPALLVRLVEQSLRVAHAWPTDDGAADEVYRDTLEAARGLALRPVRSEDGVERTLAATLDCATHRVDALPVAAALSTLDAMPAAPRVLGLYGWVDSPLRGEPGFSKDRAVLAPSPAQAKAAAILKDRYVTHAESGLAPGDAWDLGLDSHAVRRAVGLLDAVAEGGHPAEALGRLVEACFDRYPDVLQLRGGDPAGPPGGYPADGDAPLRRTCDGLAAMRDWAGDRPAFAARTGLQPAAFAPEVTAELDALAAVAGVVADLHLLEAVHDTVQGGSAVTAQALDSLAGLGEVPELRSLRTPVPGTPLTTRVQLCLSAVAEPANPQRAVLADPAVAAFLDSLGMPDDPVRFGWQRGGVVVTLADLGLAPSDLAAVDDAGLLTALERAWPGGDPTMPPGVEDVRAVIAVLNRCTRSTGPIAEIDGLRQRYARLYAAATTLVAELRAAADAADDPALRARALRWGLAGDFSGNAEIAAANLAQCPPVADVLDDDLVPALRRLAAIGRGHSDAVVVPVLAAPDAPTPLDPAPDADQWHEAFSRVRPALVQFHEALATKVTATQAAGWGPGWTGQVVPGTAALPGAARELTVVYALDGCRSSHRGDRRAGPVAGDPARPLVRRRRRGPRRLGHRRLRFRHPRRPPPAGDPAGRAAHPGHRLGPAPAAADPGRDPAAGAGAGAARPRPRGVGRIAAERAAARRRRRRNRAGRCGVEPADPGSWSARAPRAGSTGGRRGPGAAGAHGRSVVDDDAAVGTRRTPGRRRLQPGLGTGAGEDDPAQATGRPPFRRSRAAAGSGRAGGGEPGLAGRRWDLGSFRHRSVRAHRRPARWRRHVPRAGAPGWAVRLVVGRCRRRVPARRQGANAWRGCPAGCATPGHPRRAGARSRTPATASPRTCRTPHMWDRSSSSTFSPGTPPTGT